MQKNFQACTLNCTQIFLSTVMKVSRPSVFGKRIAAEGSKTVNERLATEMCAARVNYYRHYYNATVRISITAGRFPFVCIFSLTRGRVASRHAWANIRGWACNLTFERARAIPGARVTLRNGNMRTFVRAPAMSEVSAVAAVPLQAPLFPSIRKIAFVRTSCSILLSAERTGNKLETNRHSRRNDRQQPCGKKRTLYNRR